MPAQISRITAENASGSTKSFEFQLLPSNNKLDYKPGQWLDVFIPGVETVRRIGQCCAFG